MIDTRSTWKRVKRFWHDPSLSDPHLYWDASEGDKILKGEIAGFQYAGRKTHVHMPNLERRLGLESLEPVEKHEAGHDRFCPYDLKNCLSLVSASDEVHHDLERAKTDENLLADIFVNTHIIKKGDPSIINVYRKMAKVPSTNKVWNFYLQTCENVWKLPQGMLSHLRSEEIKNDAEAMSETVIRTMYDSKEWTRAMKEFSSITKKYYPEKNTSLSKKQDSGEEKPSKPVIGTHSPKDFVPYKITKEDIEAQKQLKKDLKGVSKCIPYHQFKRVAAGTGICDLPMAVKMFYLDMAGRYEIAPPSAIEKGGNVTPIFRKEWQPEDPPERLDIRQSFEEMGMVIPGVNTYQHHMKGGQGGDINRVYKDLIIALDSSGSMPDPKTYFSIPVLSSIVVAHSAINKGQRVSAINFSTDHRAIGYTSNRYEVDDVLLHYYNGNTVIPGEDILMHIESNPNPQHILLITDTEFDNLEKEIPNLEQAIRLAGSGSIFLFGNACGKTSSLQQIGYAVHKATTTDDLLSLSTQLSKELYG